MRPMASEKRLDLRRVVDRKLVSAFNANADFLLQGKIRYMGKIRA